LCGVTVHVEAPVVALPTGISISYAPIGGEGSLIKIDDSDPGADTPMVYVIQGGTRHWIINPDVFNAHHFSWDAIIRVSRSDLTSIPRGSDITQ
jgi:hypothetical protein